MHVVKACGIRRQGMLRVLQNPSASPSNPKLAGPFVLRVRRRLLIHKPDLKLINYVITATDMAYSPLL